MTNNTPTNGIKAINTYKWLIVAIITFAVAWGALKMNVSAVDGDVKELEAEIRQVPINTTNIANIKDDISELKGGQTAILNAINGLR